MTDPTAASPAAQTAEASADLAAPADAVAATPPPGFEPIQSSNPFGGRNGPIFERRTDAGWERGFRALAYHCNAGGVVHGGMLMTFADILLARAVLDVAPPPFATMRLVSDFAGPAPRGAWVSGTARCVRRTRSLVFVDGLIAADGAPALNVSGIFKLRRRPGAERP
ncbi:acyl-coenzyme A thioesterase PaaI-like protein [Rhodothalassium salexigens DSM 2132]|uniref:Acyl-coenzyme A thioesterase PaaI-like protein n=1 Tax=Rhodothalassium salexigens DSM 2132 TaxID=1188247 RepID=A0A4V2SQ72_RHOSA|nr:PaaI family thioesterase [Rhodothalassium salexigens]MBB4210829.1 acyl-coenzyme A thioesterase PaaI-like protein [Rhodothalassium salexigens DSM 2132]TCP37616.1 acyl-coenzyme A thioesterase PaaI-like protein [Rhodothalassium salexigens DSM 2132]